MVHSLYKTTNRSNKKIYIGIHQETMWPDIDDYLGSGTVLRRAVEKYGEEMFEREILCISDNREYIADLERKMVNEDFVLQESNYNLAIGGKGGMVAGQQLLAYKEFLRLEKLQNFKDSMERHKEKWLADAKWLKENNYGI